MPSCPICLYPPTAGMNKAYSSHNDSFQIAVKHYKYINCFSGGIIRGVQPLGFGQQVYKGVP